MRIQYLFDDEDVYETNDNMPRITPNLFYDVYMINERMPRINSNLCGDVCI